MKRLILRRIRRITRSRKVRDQLRSKATANPNDIWSAAKADSGHLIVPASLGQSVATGLSNLTLRSSYFQSRPDLTSNAKVDPIASLNSSIIKIAAEHVVRKQVGREQVVRKQIATESSRIESCCNEKDKPCQQCEQISAIQRIRYIKWNIASREFKTHLVTKEAARQAKISIATKVREAMKVICDGSVVSIPRLLFGGVISFAEYVFIGAVFWFVYMVIKTTVMLPIA